MSDTTSTASSPTASNGAESRTGTLLQVRPLAPAVAAEIVGLDLSQPLEPERVRALRSAFEEHVVLIVRGQTLSEEDQLRVAGYFGTVARRTRPLNGVGPGGSFDSPFMLVTNIVENGKPIGAFGDGEMWFHHDTSYYPEPHRATLLYAMQITSWGGETRFANMYAAYERIPPALRNRLDGRHVLQVHDYKRRERLNLETVDLSKVRHHEQPMFITHPATGRKALYVSRLMTARIEGLAPEESDAILAQLFDISEDPAIGYEHHWQVGDLVIWDNWASIHARKDFPREEPRLMRRLTIEGQAMRA